MRFDHWARWRESVLFWLLLDPVEVARLCLCPPTVNTETLSKVYTKNKLASATSKLPDSTRLFMHPVHSPIWLFLAATALQGYFWFLCPAFSFFSQHNFTEKPAHQKFLTSSSFVCVCCCFFSLWLICGHIPAFRWQFIDIKQAELPRGLLCGFRWRLESLLNLDCNEWLGSASTGEHRRKSLTASLWTSGLGGLCACVWREREQLWGSGCPWQQLCGDKGC